MIASSTDMPVTLARPAVAVNDMLVTVGIGLVNGVTTTWTVRPLDGNQQPVQMGTASIVKVSRTVTVVKIDGGATLARTAPDFLELAP